MTSNHASPCSHLHRGRLSRWDRKPQHPSVRALERVRWVKHLGSIAAVTHCCGLAGLLSHGDFGVEKSQRLHRPDKLFFELQNWQLELRPKVFLGLFIIAQLFSHIGLAMWGKVKWKLYSYKTQAVHSFYTLLTKILPLT